MNVSPNPFANILVIEVDNDKYFPADLQLCNMAGEVVYTHRITTTKTVIDTSHLNRGLYTVMLTHNKFEFFREMMMHD